MTENANDCSPPGEPHRLQDVLEVLRAMAPEPLAESWDQVGLHTGSLSQPIHGGLLCIDLTEAVVAEAFERQCQLIVAYHPPIFSPLRRLADEGPWTQRRILAAVRAGLAVYSPHTALDAARGGVCDWLAEVLAGGPEHLADAVPIVPTPAHRDTFKVVVFVPTDAEVAVRQAMSQAGAGGLGDYRECAFSSAGQGTFRPMPGSNPTIGTIGEQAVVNERRLEMFTEKAHLAAVLAAARQAHPYEEPAIDVLRLAAEPLVGDEQTGAGRVITLREPVTAAELASRLSHVTGEPVAVGGRESAELQRIALCPGSGGKLFESCHADAYVTGELSHHQTLDLVQSGKTVLLAGHTQTERPYLPVLQRRLRESAAGRLRWEISAQDRPPLTWA